jgi:hypothetical protein
MGLQKMSPKFNKIKWTNTNQILVDQILTKTLSSHEKAATFPSIAMILEALYGPEKAIAFLESKITEVKTPWYLQSMIANIESDQNHKERALYWSEQSMMTSKGSATRLQWISKDVVMKGKFLAGNDEKLILAIRNFFAESDKNKDAIKGRNLSSHKRVAGVLNQMGPAGQVFTKEAIKACGRDQACRHAYGK